MTEQTGATEQSGPTGTTETVRARQGSQPSFDDVRVGIIRAGLKDGVPTAQLLLRSGEETREVFVAEGASVDLLGHGQLTVAGVHRGATPQDRTEVTLTWTA